MTMIRSGLAVVLVGLLWPLAVAVAADPAPATAPATTPAVAEDPYADLKADRAEPISVSADQGTANFETETATYSGNVVVVQGALRLRANTLTILAPKGAIARIDAEGGIVLTSAAGDATAHRATYDVPARRVTMTGNVVLTQGDNVLRGNLLIVNLDSGVAELTATGAGGRVEGLFVPPPEPATPAPADTPSGQ